MVHVRQRRRTGCTEQEYVSHVPQTHALDSRVTLPAPSGSVPVDRWRSAHRVRRPVLRFQRGWRLLAAVGVLAGCASEPATAPNGRSARVAEIAAGITRQYPGAQART